MAENAAKIYQIKITLNGVKPPIWRRLHVSSAADLAELHDILQIAMGWTDSHLHMFVMGDRQYGIPDPDFDDQTIPETGVRVNTLLSKEKDSLVYEYDFGDGWEHKVVLEKILDRTSGKAVPSCIAGRRACPPEDVGGIPGYEEFLAAYTDESHPEHEELVQWVGEYFDLERFDPLEINDMLADR